MDSQQQGLLPLSTASSRGVDGSAVPDPPDGDSAAGPLAVAGDDPGLALDQLTEALRAGLQTSAFREGILVLPMPVGADPFEYFASSYADPLAGTTARHSRNLPNEAVSEPADSGAPTAFDRRVALMAQDMAAFGGLGREGPRLETRSDGLRLDYFA